MNTDFILRLRPQGGAKWDGIAPHMRLRAVLKRMLRNWGLKCVEVRAEPREQKSPALQTGQATSTKEA